MKIDVKITRVENTVNTKAYASVTFDEAYRIHGIRVIHPEGKEPLVAMPCRKITDANGKEVYVDTFHATTPEAGSALVDAVLKAYYHSEEEDMPASPARES